MTLRLLVSLSRQELRGSAGRVAFFASCLAIGVAAVVAIAGLADALDDGIRTEARTLLAADLALQSARPLPPDLESLVAGLDGWELTRVQLLATMAAAEQIGSDVGKSQLVALKVVDGRFPFYGTLRLEPSMPLSVALGDDGVAVAPELLSRLGLSLGDRLRIGVGQFTIRAIVRDEPGRVTVAFSLGPRVLLSAPGFATTGLAARGSRITYRWLLKAPPSDGAAEVAKVTELLRGQLPPDESVRLETVKDAQPTLRGGLRRTERFLGLVALVSLLVGGVGVWQAVGAWISARVAAIAIMKCLGLRRRELWLLYLVQASILALIGSSVGAAAGLVLLALTPKLLSGLLPQVTLSLWQPAALLRGLLLGLVVALLASLGPLASVLRVPAVRALRHESEPLPLTRAAQSGLLSLIVGGTFLVTVWQAHSWRYAALFCLALFVAATMLALAARGLIYVAASAGAGVGGWRRRYGIAAIARPSAGTFAAIVALGLGVTVVMTLWFVHQTLADELVAELPTTAPTAFLVDIQTDQWPPLAARLTSLGATRVEDVPIVSARLVAIDHLGITEANATKPERRDRGRWALTREQRLTYLQQLPQGNVIVAGALWNDPERAEVSVEQEFASDLGVHLGQTLSFDIQGVPIDLVVSSLRRVDWKTFGINFFLVVEPGVLEEAPQARVAACRLPSGRDAAIQDRLSAEFPNVTLISLRDILDKVVAIFDRVGLAIRLLASFTVLAGVGILGGAIAAGATRRGRDVALLKAIGMTRGDIATIHAIEFGLLGGVAGTLGTFAAIGLSWLITTWVMELSWAPRPFAALVAIVTTATLAIAAGFLASSGVLRRRPIETLRRVE